MTSVLSGGLSDYSCCLTTLRWSSPELSDYILQASTIGLRSGVFFSLVGR